MMKDKVHTRTGYEAQRRIEVWLYSFFNLGASCVWIINATPGCLTPGTRDTHCTGG